MPVGLPFMAMFLHAEPVQLQQFMEARVEDEDT
jgi:hypothetical protein